MQRASAMICFERPFTLAVPQVFAIAIGQCVKEGKLDDAKALSEGLGSLYPDYETGRLLAALLAVEPADAGAINKLATSARSELDGLIRQARLQMRLHESQVPQGSPTAERCSQLSAMARMRAAVVFPTPRGPAKR